MPARNLLRKIEMQKSLTVQAGKEVLTMPKSDINIVIPPLLDDRKVKITIPPHSTIITHGMVLFGGAEGTTIVIEKDSFQT